MNMARPPTRALAASAMLATAGAVALSLPPLRVLIEQSMVWHMLVQMPLLVAAGALWAALLQRRPWPATRAWVDRLAQVNHFGLTGLMAALVVAAYWMIPATVDRAVVLPSADAAKIVSLGLAGAALRHAVVRAPVAVQLFFIGTALPMAVWVGVYLASTDLRLCNAYSLSSQIHTGRGLVVLSLLAGAAWLAHLRGQFGASDGTAPTLQR